MKKLISILLVALLVLTGCTTKGTATPAETPNAEFAAYLDELLVESMDPKDFSINFMFVNPENYGITPEPYELTFSTNEDEAESVAETEAMIKKLESFSDKTLTAQQQLDKKVVIEQLKNGLEMAPYYDYEQGGSVIGYSRNLMGSFPAYLETYVFRNQQDVDGYFNLIETLPASIQKYIDLEKTRQTNGTGFGKEEIAEIIKVNEVTATDAASEDFYLIAHFDTAIADLDFMSAEQKTAASARNKSLLNNQFAQSYQMVVDQFKEIDAKPVTGLANKPNGKEYYEILLRQETGKNVTVAEMEKFIDRKELEIQTYLFSSFTAEEMDEMFALMQSGEFSDFEDGQALLTFIQGAYTEDFPAIEAPNYVLRQVDDSMKEASSPAFYFSPPVDYTPAEPQVIYINGEFDNKLYTTYAHEGIPGHMYQFSYFLTLKDMHPIRSLISPSSSAEGWANYAEKEAVKYVQSDKFMEFNNAYMSLIEIYHIKADIGIHHKGWTQEEFGEFFGQLFDVSGENLSEMYTQFVHSPAAYPTYYLSNLYIRDMKETAKKELGNAYDEKEFHEQILKCGAASFNVIEEQMNLYIKEKGSR